MAIVEDVFKDVFKNGFGPPLAVALGIAVIAPVAVPVLGAVVLRVLKTAIKGGALVYGYGIGRPAALPRTSRTSTARPALRSQGRRRGGGSDVGQPRRSTLKTR
jgi:hypothetical protein